MYVKERDAQAEPKVWNAGGDGAVNSKRSGTKRPTAIAPPVCATVRCASGVPSPASTEAKSMSSSNKLIEPASEYVAVVVLRVKMPPFRAVNQVPGENAPV